MTNLTIQQKNSINLNKILFFNYMMIKILNHLKKINFLIKSSKNSKKQNHVIINYLLTHKKINIPNLKLKVSKNLSVS